LIGKLAELADSQFGKLIESDSPCCSLFGVTNSNSYEMQVVAKPRNQVLAKLLIL